MSTWVPHTKNELIIEPASSGLWWEVTFVNWIQIDTKTTNWFIKLTSEEFLEVLTALEKNKSLNIDGQFPCDRPENVSKWSFGNDLIISSHCEASGMVTLEISKWDDGGMTNTNKRRVVHLYECARQENGVILKR